MLLTYPRQHDCHTTGNIDLYQIISGFSVETQLHLLNRKMVLNHNGRNISGKASNVFWWDMSRIPFNEIYDDFNKLHEVSPNPFSFATPSLLPRNTKSKNHE